MEPMRTLTPTSGRVTGDPQAAGGQAIPRLALDEREMAEALGVSPNHLAELRRLGGFPFVKLGQRIVYPVDVVRDHLRAVTLSTLTGQAGGPTSQA